MYVLAQSILLKLVDKCADDIRANEKFAVVLWYAKKMEAVAMKFTIIIRLYRVVIIIVIILLYLHKGKFVL